MSLLPFPALPAPARQALSSLDAALTRAELPADGLVLLACSAADLAALGGHPALAAVIAAVPDQPQAVVLRTRDQVQADTTVLSRAVAGRTAFVLGNDGLMDELARHLPAHARVALGTRHYLRVAAHSLPTAGRRHDFAMYCKSYRGDVQRAQVMVETFRRFNRDRLPLYISCPADDLPLFAPLAGGEVELITDESFAGPYQTRQPMNGMSVGYVNQQICKLNFYRTGLADNYLNVDSDTVFIRDFHVGDFMHDTGIPYTVLVMDKDLSIERHYRHVHWVERQKLIAQIYAQVGLADKRLRTCHGAQVFNAGVLASLHDDFMRARGLDDVEMLRLAGYEFTWYNAWFQHCRLVPEYAVEPFFKILHMRPDYILSRLKMLREEDYAQAYVGLIMNSKWRPATPLRYADPTPDHAALYATMLQDEEAIHRLRLVPATA